MTVQPAQIRTERLMLRPFHIKDVDDVFGYASDEEFARYLPGVPKPYTRGDAEKFVARCVKMSWNNRPTFAIVLDETVIGAIEVNIEASRGIASLHYAIARQHWNKGLMSESVRAVIKWSFDTFDLVKVYCWTDVRNVGSWRVMEKVGMSREGHFRSHGIIDGKRVDFYYYGVLREEWMN